MSAYDFFELINHSVPVDTYQIMKHTSMTLS